MVEGKNGLLFSEKVEGKEVVSGGFTQNKCNEDQVSHQVALRNRSTSQPSYNSSKISYQSH